MAAGNLEHPQQKGSAGKEMLPTILSTAFVLYLILITFFISPDPKIAPVRNIPLIDSIIREYFPPEDLQSLVPYKNHCYRVYNLAVHAVGRDLTSAEQETLAIAMAFHDISVFLDETLDYLDPSAGHAEKWMKKHNKPQEDIDHVVAIIVNHHKLMSYEGNYQDLVEAVRKADLIDVSFGVVTFHLDRATIKALRDPIPSAGFHWFLVRTLAKWVVKHPSNPVPFLRW